MNICITYLHIYKNKEYEYTFLHNICIRYALVVKTDAVNELREQRSVRQPTAWLVFINI